MSTKTIYSLVITNDRGDFLMNYLQENGVEIKRIDDWSNDAGEYEIIIESNTDLLQIFHAGIHFGVKQITK